MHAIKERELYDPSPPPSDREDSDEDPELSNAEIAALQKAYQRQLSLNMWMGWLIKSFILMR